jgi:hypothetical protein
MPPKITGTLLLERWRTFIFEHKAAPVEYGGAGHALAVATRQKLAAGHLSISEIAELNLLKGEALKASKTNSGDTHPAAVSGVGAQPGAGSSCDSGVQQSGDAHPTGISHDTSLDCHLQRQSPQSSGDAQSADIRHNPPVLPTISLDDKLLRQVLQLGRLPRTHRNPQTDAEIAETRLKKKFHRRPRLLRRAGPAATQTGCAQPRHFIA